MAARLETDLGVHADLVEGRRGEFSIWVGDTCVAEKTSTGFPADDAVVRAVREALAR